MALTPVSVSYASIFANGTLTATSVGATWANEERIADHFINRIASTDVAPTGETIIKVDQGADASKYITANRIIIPAKHNIPQGTSIFLEYSANDADWTSIANPVEEKGVIKAGQLYSATFDKVTAGSGNRYWRFRFTMTSAAVQIPEIWVTEKIELGQSEPDADEVRGPASPLDFSVVGNIEEIVTREGSRSAVEIGPARREMLLQGEALTAAAFGDWDSFVVSISHGLKPFFVDDPRGNIWFAAAEPGDRSLDNPERWTTEIRVAEVI